MRVWRKAGTWGRGAAVPWLAVSLSLGVAGCGEETARGAQARRPIPVEVAAIRQGTIEARRTFSGTLEPFAEFGVAPTAGGRVARVHVDIGDPVEQGSVVVTLDDAEPRQALALAQAQRKVAQADATGAMSTLASARRELERAQALQQGGIGSAAQLDGARTRVEVAEAASEVAQAGVSRAQAELEVARIRLNDTRVRATWTEGDGERVVAARHVDPGDTVGASSRLLTIMELDPLVAVISVTERDYAQLHVGQAATLSTDAAPGQTFSAKVSRISPAFSRASRQARVELLVDNGDLALKPGAFARVTITLAEADRATIVPEAALTRRNGQDGVFVVNADHTVSWRPVTVGLRDGPYAQVQGAELSGQVVTLGQQLIDDGVRVTLPEPAEG